jgi:hypothetical protein
MSNKIYIYFKNNSGFDTSMVLIGDGKENR